MVAAKDVRTLAKDAIILADYIVKSTSPKDPRHKAAERVLNWVQMIREAEELELAKKQEELRKLMELEKQIAGYA